MTVSHWSDANRIISGPVAEPGPWRTDRVPYMREIMDAYGDMAVEEIVILGPAQSGKTEGVFNMIGYTADLDPVPSMYVIAREEDCEDITNDRLYPMFRDSPALARHLTGRPWDIKKGRVFYLDRMPLYFASAQSAPALASKPIGRIFLDETDKYPAKVGAEGSPAALAKRRTTTFGDVKIVYLCTVTTKDGFIWKVYHQSDMRQYYMPCPRCGRWFIGKFGQLKVEPPDLRDAEIIIENECVYYECELCTKRIEQREKSEMVAAGKWVPAGCRVDNKGRITGTPKRGPRRSGFFINPIIPPWLLWHRILAEFFEITAGGDPDALREFKNQVLAEPWEQAGAHVEEMSLHERIGSFSRGTVPNECLILLAGADYHVDEREMVRIDYEVRGFGWGQKNWVVNSGSAGSFDELTDEVLLSPFPWASPKSEGGDRPPLAVVCLFVDSGYKPDEVYDYCMQYPGVAYPTKGAAGRQRTPLIAGKLDRVTPERARRYRGMQLIIVDTEFFKDRVTTWATRQPGAPGATEFYAEIPDRYFKDFCNEHKVESRDKYGRKTWHWVPVSKGAHVHHLDTAVLAAAAAYYRRVHVLFGREPKSEYKEAAAMASRMKRKRRIGRMNR